jgi:hypothetical protein
LVEISIGPFNGRARESDRTCLWARLPRLVRLDVKRLRELRDVLGEYDVGSWFMVSNEESKLDPRGRLLDGDT